MSDRDLHARVAAAASAREVSDLSRAVLGDCGHRFVPGDLIRSARQVRVAALLLVDRAVIAELLAGASWEDVAAAVGTDAATAERIYLPALELWSEEVAELADAGDHGVGGLTDLDLPGTADALDMWWRRHAEPWESAEGASPIRTLVDRLRQAG